MFIKTYLKWLISPLGDTANKKFDNLFDRFGSPVLIIAAIGYIVFVLLDPLTFIDQNTGAAYKETPAVAALFHLCWLVIIEMITGITLLVIWFLSVFARAFVFAFFGQTKMQD